MLENLPKKFITPVYVGLVSFVVAETVGLLVALVEGKFIDIGCGPYYIPQPTCYSLLPTTPWEWGQFTGRQLGVGFVALILYWWVIGRKKDPEDVN